MTSTVRHARSRSLFALCLLAGCLSLVLSGCGGGGGGTTGGGGGGGGTTNYTISVASTNPASGVVISYGNSATSLLTTGTTAFSVTESSGTTMIFGAPATAGSNNFSSWSGCSSVSGANCTVTVTGNVTITANYVTPVAPTVTVTPSPATITTAQALSVGVTVAASQGGATPTGSIVLTSGSYTSAAATLSGGSATISVPAGTLPAGTDSLKATYTPDSASSAAYTTSSGTGSVTVNAAAVAPAVTVTPSPTSITTAQALSVTVAVAASQGGATPTGSVVLTSGSYTSPAATLSNGSATISVPAGSLATGTDSLKATYTPDSASSTAYTTSSGTGSVMVTLPPPTMSIGLSSSSILTTQSVTATITVSGTPTPTGSVVLSSGSYTTSSTTLSAGVAVITVPAGSLAAGSDTLTATYTPDSSSSSTYGSGTKTAPVTVSYAVTVNSTNPASGVSITVSPKDANGNGSGTTPLSLAYGPNAAVTLTAPATTSSGGTFTSWTGCSSTSGTPALTCTLNVTAIATVTANYASISVSPTGNVTIGQSQQFTATVTGLSPSTVTWAVAVASGTGSAGTISSSGVYQTPYPAPTTVTVTATSTANTAIKGTATIALAAPPTATGPALSVDAGAVTRAISPLIYGMNAYLLDSTTAQNTNTTVVRWGGDATSRYNYQNANSNSAADYYFQNGGAYAMLTTNSNSVNSEANFNDFIAETTALGIKSIGTAPVQGYVSNSSTSACSFPKSTYPNQQSYNSSNCGNGVYPQGTNGCTTAGGCSLFGNPSANPPTWQTTSLQEPPPVAPTPASGANVSWAQATWTGSWVNCLITTGANCTSAAGHDASIWDLDNEPAWWDAVHRDVHPSPSSYDEVTNGGVGTALAIKTLDSNALTSGPVIDYWWNYFYSKQDIEGGWSSGSPCYQPWSNPTDRKAHGGTPMIVYYLQQMASASNTYGMRLLDYLTIHAYVAASYNGSSVAFTTAGDTGEQLVRMNSTRALWDPTYNTDPNFVQPNYTTDVGYTSSCSVPLQAPQIIPMMQSWLTSGWTGTTYAAPGTSIDEYNFGGTESINGAVTQADVLGIFGKYGLTMGVFWPTTNYSTQGPANMAFEMYRNYDGNKSVFGDQELTSSTGDQSKLAVYAASRTSDGTVTIMVINKTYGSLTDTLSLNNLTSTATSAQVYQYSNANLNAIVAQPAANITAGTPSTISATFPAQSITLLVIPSH